MFYAILPPALVHEQVINKNLRFLDEPFQPM